MWASPGTRPICRRGEYQSSWGGEGTKEVVKQFAGQFTLKSGGQVSTHSPSVEKVNATASREILVAMMVVLVVRGLRLRRPCQLQSTISGRVGVQQPLWLSSMHVLSLTPPGRAHP